MPKGYKKTDDPHERLNQQAEIAHKKEVDALLGRFQLDETDDVAQALVGKVRARLKDSLS